MTNGIGILLAYLLAYLLGYFVVPSHCFDQLSVSEEFDLLLTGTGTLSLVSCRPS